MRARPSSMHQTASAGEGGRWSLPRRLMRTLVLACIYIVLEVVAKAIVVVQLCWLIVRGRPHPWLAARGAETARFLQGMWAYLSCAEDQAPWPFAPWPSAAETAAAPPTERHEVGPVQYDAEITRLW